MNSHGVDLQVVWQLSKELEKSNKVLDGLTGKISLCKNSVTKGASYCFMFFKRIQHEQYNTGSASYANDIAILTLKTLITLGGNVAVATLPPNNDNLFVGDSCVITGWGRTCK